MNRMYLLIVTLLMLVAPAAVHSSPIPARVAMEPPAALVLPLHSAQVVPLAQRTAIESKGLILACLRTEKGKCGPAPCRFK